jgi:hypothetical protein
MGARTGWALAVLTLCFVAADIAVTAAYRPLFSEASVAVHGFPFTQLAVLGSGLLGAVILTRHEGHAVGVLLSLVGVLSSFSLLTEAYHVWVVDAGGPGPAELAAVAGWLSSLLGGQAAFALLGLMFLLAPDGELLSPGWRWAGRASVAGLALCSVSVASLDPTTFELSQSDVGPVRGAVFTLGFALIGGGLIAAVVSLWLRLRRSTGDERRQVLLIALSVVALVVGLANMLLVEGLTSGGQTWVSSLPLLVAYALVPVLFSVAALRYRLYDLEVVVNRTVVLAIGFAFAGAGYVTVVVLVGRLVDTRTGGLATSLLATAVVALAFQPLRRGVIAAANRIAYGARAQPYAALSDFSGRLADTPAADALLPAVAEAAGRAVAARHAEATLQVSEGEVLSTATWGSGAADAMTSAHVVPVRNDDETLGSITVDVLSSRPLRVADQRLLEALADQAAVAFRNLAMESRLTRQVAELDRTTRQLAESRARILEADVVARRELEQAISTRVLPRLVALPERLREARAAVQAHAGANGLEELVADVNAVLEELRELTRGVFPAQLARAGVVPTLRSFLTRIEPAPILSIDQSAEARRFPARVESAVYYGSVEATRLHPRTMALAVDGDELVLTVDGMARSAGDLGAVCDRVDAVGGSLSLVDDRLELRLPVDQPAEADQASVSRSGLRSALATYAAAPDPPASHSSAS